MKPTDPPRARPAFREPMLWLVVGLPLCAVLASLLTLAIALSLPDERTEPPPAVRIPYGPELPG